MFLSFWEFSFLYSLIFIFSSFLSPFIFPLPPFFSHLFLSLCPFSPSLPSFKDPPLSIFLLSSFILSFISLLPSFCLFSFLSFSSPFLYPSLHQMVCAWPECQRKTKKRDIMGQWKYYKKEWLGFFSKSHDRHQTTDPSSSKNTNGVNTKNPTCKHIIFKLQETKDKEKIL